MKDGADVDAEQDAHDEFPAEFEDEASRRNSELVAPTADPILDHRRTLFKADAEPEAGRSASSRFDISGAIGISATMLSLFSGLVGAFVGGLLYAPVLCGGEGFIGQRDPTLPKGVCTNFNGDSTVLGYAVSWVNMSQAVFAFGLLALVVGAILSLISEHTS